jgi:hypothetical protein
VLLEVLVPRRRLLGRRGRLQPADDGPDILILLCDCFPWDESKFSPRFAPGGLDGLIGPVLDILERLHGFLHWLRVSETLRDLFRRLAGFVLGGF